MAHVVLGAVVLSGLYYILWWSHGKEDSEGGKKNFFFRPRVSRAG